MGVPALSGEAVGTSRDFGNVLVTVFVPVVALVPVLSCRWLARALWTICTTTISCIGAALRKHKVTNFL